jgi:hypothetical protein
MCDTVELVSSVYSKIVRVHKPATPKIRSILFYASIFSGSEGFSCQTNMRRWNSYFSQSLLLALCQRNQTGKYGFLSSEPRRECFSFTGDREQDIRYSNQEFNSERVVLIYFGYTVTGPYILNEHSLSI